MIINKNIIKKKLDISSLSSTIPLEILPNLIPASVLIPIVPQGKELLVMLTKRTDHLYHHPGQISFPGGKAEHQDQTAIMTALREAQEEIGLQSEAVDILGVLPDYVTLSSHYRITPVVGWIEEGFSLKPDPVEVAEIFTIPLNYCLEMAHYQTKHLTVKGKTKAYFLLDYHIYQIWGATAAMLHSLSRLLKEN